MLSILIRRSLIALLLLSLIAAGAPLARADEPAAAPAPAAQDQPPAAALGPLATGGLSGCSRSAESWQTSELVPQPILSCTIAVAESGKLVINADGYVSVAGNPVNANYEANFAIAVGAAAKQTQYIDTMADSHDSNDQAVSLTAGAAIGAGSHTITFKGARGSSSGVPATLNKPTLSVLFVPDSSPDIEVCFSNVSAWSNATTSESAIVQCSLTATTGGRVFIFGSGTAYLKDSSYEAHFTARKVGDTNAGSDRYVNVAANTNDGTDRAVATIATSLILSASSFNVALYGNRSIGSGTVGVRNASLVAVFIPATSNNPTTYCDDVADGLWSANLYNFDVPIASCTLVADQPGWLWVMGGGAVGQASGVTTDGQIRTKMFVNGTQLPIDHKANVYPNTDDGTDAVTSSAMMVRVMPGQIAISYMAEQLRGDLNKFYIRDGGLTALFIPASFTYIPAVIK
jgi:hypothetical protein